VDRGTSAEGLASLATMEVSGSSLEEDREALEEDSTSLGMVVVQELSLPSGVSLLSLCEEEEEGGKPEPSTPELPGALPPVPKQAAGCVPALGSVIDGLAGLVKCKMKDKRTEASLD